ncbi:pantetheine-phosphate adenylyltransferase [Neoasaia chiangmaiensis NBRC 101099]|uniref:Phosphopantetheine adenylyltransferase n=1 Tax=Neoasaia chiangmaiensis TaxID=320497 RepID=A0A1U9KUD0_9PROT|nr:pantetheine-phosphate adenylyltransferase [Neoasaia chiangmaiensis]AQS89395.1 pantetheine-phosphate adenylyltransferase [Neoasaia chiangmaiensis]GBR39059.1 pantetheine-phosphate adenylyltransferase [Neoasaia chiangmaiensis NBRC 101099]GEN15579.1 phosphopantetheine adenylyltransferase [Neoasaia chiangmaiensis]
MRVGFYPGTFDPVTFGHLDIIVRASALFDRLVVGVAVNEGKRPLLTLDERIGTVRQETAGLSRGAAIEVVGFDTLLVRAVRDHGATCIVRGLRAVSDFDFEAQLSGANRRLAPEIETIFLLASEEQRTTASRIVKEIARLGGAIDKFVPRNTASLVLSKLRDGAT